VTWMCQDVVSGGKMRSSTLGFAAAICVALAACADGTGPRTMLVTRIDRAALDSVGSLKVSFTITNVGSQSEDVPACAGRPGASVQRQQGMRWEDFAGSLCSAIYSAVPVSLPPGASISGSANVFRAGPGVYRLVVSFQRDGSARAVSEQFRVNSVSAIR
jgi:hypothetical protein